MPMVREWMGEAIVGRGITTQVVGNVQIVAPVVVVVNVMVVRFRVVGLWSVIWVGVVRLGVVEGLRMVVGAVVDWFRMVDGQRGWWPIVDYMANRRKNMRLVVPMTSWAKTYWAWASWTETDWSRALRAKTKWAGTCWTRADWAGTNCTRATWAKTKCAGACWSRASWARTNYTRTSWAGTYWTRTNWAKASLTEASGSESAKTIWAKAA